MKYRITPVLTAIALAGFLFCLFSALGITDRLCLTQGCEVYRGYTIAGLSLYWVGAAVFLVLAVISLWKRGYVFLLILTALTLAGNLVFLLIQFMFWTCTNCLIVAALLGIFAWYMAGHVKSGFRVLCLVWLLLFSANLLGLVKESISPWPVLGKNNAEIQVFFSPGCPACRQVMENFLQHPDFENYVAFYPLAKDNSDHQRINLLVQNLNQGMPASQAFAVHWEEIPLKDDLDTGRNRYITFNLWRNQMHLAKKGATQVPLIILTTSLGEYTDKAFISPKGCSIFSPDTEDCEDEPPPDPFETIFK